MSLAPSCPVLDLVSSLNFDMDIALTQYLKRRKNICINGKNINVKIEEVFTVASVESCLVGTAGIILQAPPLYDSRPAIDVQLSGIGGVAPSQ